MLRRSILGLAALLLLTSCNQMLRPDNSRLPGQSSGGPNPFDEPTGGPPPIVRGISPATAKPGDYLTIYGAFLYGSVVTVRFPGETTNKVTRSVDGHRLTLHVPWGAKSGEVVVVVDDKESEPVEFQVQAPLAAADPTRAPRVTAVEPKQGRAGDPVRVSGANLRGEFVLVRFGGVEVAPMSVDPKGGGVSVPVPGNARTGSLDVVVDGVLSNSVPFTVLDAKGEAVPAERPEKGAPILEWIFPPHGKPGTPVEIGGQFLEGKEYEANFLGGSTTDVHRLEKSGNLLVVIPKDARTGVMDIVIDGRRSNRMTIHVDR